MSENKKNNLWQKLLEVKKQVKSLGKDAVSGEGKFAYQYVSESNVLNLINPILNKEGVLCKKEVMYDSVQVQEVHYKTKNDPDKIGYLYHVPLRFTFINVDNPEEREVNFWMGFGENGIDKGYGSALTYGNRYFYLKYFDFPTDSDDVDAKPEPQQVTKSIPRKEHLTPYHKSWDQAKEALHKGTVTLEKILLKYELTEENKNKLLEEAL